MCLIVVAYDISCKFTFNSVLDVFKQGSMLITFQAEMCQSTFFEKPELYLKQKTLQEVL